MGRPLIWTFSMHAGLVLTLSWRQLGATPIHGKDQVFIFVRSF